ncbi:unnamed protein product [Calypogeia fissa]
MGSIGDAAVTVYTAPHSWYAQRVRIALEEKGIAYTPIDVNLANRPQGLLDANPIYKKIPTIVHNGKPVAESLIIMEYLEDEWSTQVPLLPKDAYERSQVRSWADYIYKSADILLDYKLVNPARSIPGSPEQKAAQEASVNFLRTLESAMTSFSKDGPFFTGATFGYLDVVVAPFPNLLTLAEKLGGVPVPGADELPRLYKCMETCAARPSYKAVIPSKEEALQFFTALIEKRKKAAAEAAAAAST